MKIGDALRPGEIVLPLALLPSGMVKVVVNPSAKILFGIFLVFVLDGLPDGGEFPAANRYRMENQRRREMVSIPALNEGIELLNVCLF